jgi:hypothetical protein
VELLSIIITEASLFFFFNLAASCKPAVRCVVQLVPARDD